MLNDSTWKQRLIRYAHTSRGYSVPLRSRPHSPKTVLGQKILPRKTMSYSTNWLTRIKGEIRHNEPLAKHTSFRIGGPADLFIMAKDSDDLRVIFKNKGEQPVFILGEGTNLLVPDAGIRGIVVCLRDGFKALRKPVFSVRADGKEAGVLRVDAGVKMSYLAKFAARYSLAGIEGLAGVPGSLGGALAMNAGAEGQEIGQVLRSLTRVTAAGEIETLPKSAIEFHYRKAVFPEGGGVIVSAELELVKSDSGAIYETIDRLLSKRSARQPLTLPNAGSIFKNPPNDKAGRLIEAAGLKGFRIGDAAVSRKHANFIVNTGAATAQDVLGLIEHIKHTVKEKTGVELEEEIIVAGR